MLRAFLFFGLVASGAGLVSCSHYRLGAETGPTFFTLHVSVVSSETVLPQARAIISAQLRDAFIKDGRVRLVDSSDGADATLTMTLVTYERGVAVVRTDDTGLARRLDLALSVRTSLFDNRSQTPIFTDRPIVARRGAFTDSGQLQSEYQAVPLLATQLAEQTVKAVLTTW